MVKRYDLRGETDIHGQPYYDISEVECGNYVALRDYAALEHEAEILVQRNALLEAECARLKKLSDDLYDAGSNGIGYVGSANYRSRQEEAQAKLDGTYYGTAQGGE